MNDIHHDVTHVCKKYMLNNHPSELNSIVISDVKQISDFEFLKKNVHQQIASIT